MKKGREKSRKCDGRKKKDENKEKKVKKEVKYMQTGGIWEKSVRE
jgi:hypothetical protein